MCRIIGLACLRATGGATGLTERPGSGDSSSSSSNGSNSRSGNCTWGKGGGGSGGKQEASAALTLWGTSLSINSPRETVSAASAQILTLA